MKILMTATFACFPIASANVEVEATTMAEAHAAISPMIEADTLVSPLRKHLSDETIGSLVARQKVFCGLHLPRVATGDEQIATVRHGVTKDGVVSTLRSEDAPRDKLIVCFSILGDAEQPDGVIEQWTLAKGKHGAIVMGVATSDVKGRFAVGDQMHTSIITTPQEEIVEGAIVQTRNSRYLLGKPASGEMDHKMAVEMLWLGMTPVGTAA